MAESPEEKEALEKLDEETNAVAWGEFQKEADRELSTGALRGPGRLGWLFGRFRPFRRQQGRPVAEPLDDPDPGDEHGLRETLHDDGAPET